MNEHAERWVRDLETTSEKQAEGQLCGYDFSNGEFAYCCLGRACETLGIPKDTSRSLIAVKASMKDNVMYADFVGKLPPEAQTKLGLRTPYGEFICTEEVCTILDNEKYYPGQEMTLADLNDAGVDFRTIARIIRLQPPGLFVDGGKNATD